MSLTTAAARPVAIPAETTSWVTRLRAGVIVGMLGLLIAGRVLGQLQIPLTAITLIALGAFVYNAGLAAVAWYARDQPAPSGDRLRTRVLYAGGILDTIALALIILATGGLHSPWLYFFLATSIVSSATLPPATGQALTIINAAAAILVVCVSVVHGVALAPELLPANFWAQPGYAAVVGLSLIGLMALTAYAVSVPVETARAASRFQEGLGDVAAAVHRAPSLAEALDVVCTHAWRSFAVDRVTISLLEGEQLVIKAVAGPDPVGLLGRRVAVSDARSLDVEVLRRRGGFYVNNLRRSQYRAHPLVAELGDSAVLLVPLLGSLGVLGVLSLTYRRRGQFTPTAFRWAGILAAQAGAAVESARLLDRVREEADSTAALLRASERLTKSYDLSALLTDLNQIAVEMVQGERSTTFLWDSARQVFYFGSTFGNTGPLLEAIRQMEFPRNIHPLIERVLAGETFVLSPEEAAGRLPDELRRTFRLGDSAVVPLKTEEVHGVMTVSYTRPGQHFSAEQLWMLHGVARHAALAIDRARLAAQEREATATAEALVTLGRRLSANLDRRRTWSVLPEMAATAAGCDFGVLALWDREVRGVRIQGAHGFAPADTQRLLGLAIPTGVFAFGDGFGDDRILEIPHPKHLEAEAAQLMAQWQVSSVLSYVIGPLNRQIGTIAIGYRQRTGAFSAAQKRLLDGIAQQAAVVFDNIRLVEDLRQANRLKSDFLSTMSHELRTPLNAIIGYTDLFREGALGPLSGEQKGILDVVARKGLQLLELINTTLDLTRLEGGQAQVDTGEFTLAELLDEIGDDLADEVPAGVEFHWGAAPGLPTMATDRGKLKTVVKNLAHNALKFTPTGSVDIRAVPAAAPGAVQIVVRDTGIGIDPKSRAAIFEMFRQLEPADTRQYGGVGLGLYIVQRFLELIDGEVHVESAPGMGSTFTVTLPVHPNGPMPR